MVFWDVDTQVDFMSPAGKLYVPDAAAIVPALARLTRHARDRGLRIVASADDHEPGHPELSDTPDFVSSFPEHCMRGTPGQRKIPETALRDPLVIDPEPVDPAELTRQVAAHRGDILFHKHWFDVFTNPNVLPVVDALAPDRIVLYGVALDVCDKYAIEGLLTHRPGLELTLVTDAARAIHPDRVPGLLDEWTARGVRLATVDEVIAG